MKPPVRRVSKRPAWRERIEREGILAREAGLDIETTHLKGDFGHILCACLKPLGEPPVVLRLDRYPHFKQRMWDDGPLVDDLTILLECTGRSYGWYSKRFDLRFLRTRRLLASKPGSRRFLHRDLWELRTAFLFHNNRLETFMHNLTDHKKTDLRPLEWERAAYGDRSCMDYVVDHCVADVEGMEAVYLKLESHILRWPAEFI